MQSGLYWRLDIRHLYSNAGFCAVATWLTSSTQILRNTIAPGFESDLPLNRLDGLTIWHQTSYSACLVNQVRRENRFYRSLMTWGVHFFHGVFEEHNCFALFTRG